MDEHEHHESLITSLTEDYSDVFANSEQGIYIYLDDIHKVCNKKFAALLGYESEEEWAKIDSSFPDAFVDDQSQETIISAFMDAMEKNIGSANSITWKRKDGSTIDTEVILVPIVHQNHLLALHFVSNK